MVGARRLQLLRRQVEFAGGQDRPFQIVPALFVPAGEFRPERLQRLLRPLEGDQKTLPWKVIEEALHGIVEQGKPVLDTRRREAV